MTRVARKPRYKCLLLTMMVMTFLFMTAGPQVVSAANNPPVITSVLPENGTVYQFGEEISLQVEAYDPDDDDLTYVWREVDIEHAHSAAVNLRYMHPGEHFLILEVSDGNSTVYRDLNFIVEGEIEEDSDPPIGLLVALIIAIILTIVVAAFAIMKRSRK